MQSYIRNNQGLCQREAVVARLTTGSLRLAFALGRRI
jgi:hypothetical protein